MRLSRRRSGPAALLLILAGVLWAIRLQESKAPLPIAPVGTTAPPAAVSVQTTTAPRAPKSDRVYDFTPIRTALLRERLALAGCLMRNRDFAHGQLQMTLRWAHQGKLEHLALVPDAGQEVQTCLMAIASHWVIRPHPSFQPFSYTVILEPRGL